MIKFMVLTLFCLAGRMAMAQSLPADITTALKTDDTAAMVKFVTSDNLNTCYGQYSLLSQTIRYGAKKCFDYLIARGANVNVSCQGYVPPLMHAAKYGRLDMVKELVAKGADPNYTYNGDYEPAKGQNPLAYAEKYNQKDVADYLRSVKKN